MRVYCKASLSTKREGERKAMTMTTQRDGGDVSTRTRETMFDDVWRGGG